MYHRFMNPNFLTFLQESELTKLAGKVCFIDLEKVFDSLNHENLLRGIFRYEICGPMFEFMKKRLHDKW